MLVSAALRGAAALFLYLPPCAEDPPSFPTRRSSDLGFAPRPFVRCGLGNQERRRIFPSERFPPLQLRSRRERDRKSTRLNSSHQIISYAVFCLKKKKKELLNNVTRIRMIITLTERKF